MSPYRMSALVSIFCLVSLMLVPRPVLPASPEPSSSTPKSSAQVQVPDRPSRPLFEGQQAQQQTEIRFNPSTQISCPLRELLL